MQGKPACGRRIGSLEGLDLSLVDEGCAEEMVVLVVLHASQGALLDVNRQDLGPVAIDGD